MYKISRRVYLRTCVRVTERFLCVCMYEYVSRMEEYVCVYERTGHGKVSV